MRSSTPEIICVFPTRLAFDTGTPFKIKVDVPNDTGKNKFMDELLEYINNHKFVRIGNKVFNCHSIFYIYWDK